MKDQTASHKVRLLLHGSIAAFAAYFCMYAFRKPFTAARFDGLSFFHVDYKILLVIAQVIGYMLSKFIGIKIISELQPSRRKYLFAGLVLLAELSLWSFAITPAPYNIFFMFLNGLPLGMIWGIVFSYIEGRKFTEILGVALCTSFIISSGVVKSVGLWLMSQWNVSAFWMPFTTGALFIIPLFISIWTLEKLPAPTEEDKALRTERLPMTRTQRKALMQQFALPLTLLIFFYVILSAFRDFRDNFARELWDSLGYAGDISVYSSSEIVIAVVVLLMLGALYRIQDNRKALLIYHIILIAGAGITGLSTLFFHLGWLSPFSWMVASGFGLYSCYVPFNALFFDRFIAAFRIRGNAGFLIYLADSFGYLGSIVVLLYRNFGMSNISWLHFFMNGAYLLSAIGMVMVAISYYYFRHQPQQKSIIAIV